MEYGWNTEEMTVRCIFIICCHDGCPGDNSGEGSSVPVFCRWLSPGNRTFLEIASMVVTWWIVACFCTVYDE